MRRLLLLALSLFPISAHAYVLGLHTESNNPDEIRVIEQRFGVHSGIVGFIFDTFTDAQADTIRTAVQKLGTDRIYHVTISPLGLSAEEVADGKHDAEYRRFFRIAKDSGGRFVFRTMHEMNGSWYSWAGNPYTFRSAWSHVFALSREAGLDRSNMLFDFSINSEDLPSETGILGGPLNYCTPNKHEQTGCFAFEDFLPEPEEVDIVGVSVYNWGRGRSESWTKWRDFRSLINSGEMNTFRRLQALQKPIFIDEVGTTSVDFTGSWSQEKVRESYLSSSGTLRKNAWIRKLGEVVDSTPDIRGVLYFNRDKTEGLTDRTMIGELDWASLSFRLGKSYSGMLDLYRSRELDDGSRLFTVPSTIDAFQNAFRRPPLSDTIKNIVDQKIQTAPAKKKRFWKSVRKLSSEN